MAGVEVVRSEILMQLCLTLVAGDLVYHVGRWNSRVRIGG